MARLHCLGVITTTPKMHGNVQARLEGDEYVINGQKSA